MGTANTETTMEEVRKISGFENLSQEELLKVIESIKELSLILNLLPSDDPYLKK